MTDDDARTCPLCGERAHDAAVSAATLSSVHRILERVDALAVVGSHPDLEDAGVQWAVALHPVVHDPSHLRANHVALARWLAVTRPLVRPHLERERERARGRLQYDPYDPFDGWSGRWLLRLSWVFVGVVFPAALLVTDGNEPGWFLWLAGTVWPAWAGLFVWRARPTGTTGQALLWAVVFMPFALVDVTWKMTRRRVGA